LDSSQRSIGCIDDFVLDNLFGPKYTIVKPKLQVKRIAQTDNSQTTRRQLSQATSAR
jgi:hypothetical protein